jgi:uncharacterized protein YndB with AHSA1/START domain
MTTFEDTIQIAAPPETVWMQLIHPDKIRKWWNSVQRYEFMSEKQTGLGMTFVIEERIGRGPLAKVKFEVTHWAKNERIAFRMISGSGVRTYEMVWELEPSEGGTKFSYIELFSPTNTLQDRLWGMLGRRTGQGHVKDRLARLKALAEKQAQDNAARAVT